MMRLFWIIKLVVALGMTTAVISASSWVAAGETCNLLQNCLVQTEPGAATGQPKEQQQQQPQQQQPQQQPKPAAPKCTITTKGVPPAVCSSGAAVYKICPDGTETKIQCQ